MRIHLGCDPDGLALKRHLDAILRAAGYEVVDHGLGQVGGGAAADDELAVAIVVGQAVAAEPGTLGVLVGAHGNGSQVAANKVVGVRAAVVWNERSAEVARARLDANVVAVGAALVEHELAARAVLTFLATPFGGRPGDQRRIDEITDYEADR